jgi:hypothetical protein
MHTKVLIDGHVRDLVMYRPGHALDVTQRQLSNVAEFFLLPGANKVAYYASTAGAPTITALMRWRDAYQGVD